LSHQGQQPPIGDPLGHPVEQALMMADAIRFAIEELPPELLLAAQLRVADETFNSDAIRRLYESVDYPLARRAADRRAT
jgi:hypothetical protein